MIIPSLNKPKPILPVEMPRIPAGPFIFLNGETRSLPKAFWIDKYEVTIAQYAEFLAELQANPTDRYDHPDQAEAAPKRSIISRMTGTSITRPRSSAAPTMGRRSISTAR